VLRRPACKVSQQFVSSVKTEAARFDTGLAITTVISIPPDVAEAFDPPPDRSSFPPPNRFASSFLLLIGKRRPAVHDDGDQQQ
jgi:hypothetical protein